MKKILFFVVLFFTITNTHAQFSVSPDKHYILRDGKPFFWLGDTGWELFHRLTTEQTEFYFKHRAEQGFTVIQAVVLAEFDGLHTPNANGDIPLHNDDPTQPNEAYFKHVDSVIDLAAKYNLVIAFLPTWGDKIFKDSWGKGPEVFNITNAKIYGEWLGNRYKNKTNIIWVLGGDRIPRNDTDKNIWRAMAAGIIEGAGKNACISFHPQPNEKGSREYFNANNDDWLSFNMFQNGHCRDNPVYEKINASYNIIPTKPVLDAEPIYEDHPVCFNAQDLGTSSAYDVRKYAYLDLFSGAFGHTYGCHDIWQFYSPDHEAVNGPHVYWQQAMDLPGATQMKYVRKLIESHPMLQRVPDQSIIIENNNTTSERIQATRGNDYIFIYSAAGKSFNINMQKISGSTLNAYWFNPRNGETKMLRPVQNSSTQKFTPPSSGYGQDWVLVLDDASKNYPIVK